MKILLTLLALGSFCSIIVSCAAPAPTAAPARAPSVEEVNGTIFLDFNFMVSELQDPRVRQAIFRAIDREELVAFDSPGSLIVATSAVAPNGGSVIPAMAPDWQYKANEAQTLLTDAGYSDGFEVELYYVASDDYYFGASGESIAGSIKEDLASIGVEVTLNRLSVDEFEDKKGLGELRGLILSSNEISNSLAPFVSCGGHCGEPDPPGSFLEFRPDVAQLYQQTLNEGDEQVRQEKLRQIESQFYSDWGRLWLVHVQQ